MFKGLAFQFSVGTLLIISVIFSVYGVIDYRTASSALKTELEQDIKLAVTNMTTNLALGEHLWSFNQGSIETALKSSLINEEIAAVAVIDQTGLVVAAFQSTDEGVERMGSLEKETGFVDYPVLIENIDEFEQVGILKLKKYTGHIDEELSKLVMENLVKTVLVSIVLVLTIIILMRFLVSRPIKHVVLALQDISRGEGDLTKRLPENSIGEIGELATYFNQFVQRIHTMVQEVSGSTHELTGAVTTLKGIVDSNSSRVCKQQQETDQVAQSIQKMSSSAEDVAHNAERAAKSATEADGQANTAMQVVHKTVDSVQTLASEFTKGTESINSVQSSVDEISSVLDVIRGIAEQTNLLALNAAIEAARAGEQGRGFAVVADEVRALAGRTQQSTGEIQSMIERLQTGAGDAVAVMQNGSEASNNAVNIANEALGNIGEIVKHVSSVTEMNQYISSTVNEQSNVSQAVNANVNRIANLAQETSDVSQEALQISETVSTSSSRLEKLVESFKV